MWRARPFSTRLLFKLQWASPACGGLAPTVNDNHRPKSMTSYINLNTILCTEGLANQAHTMFLLDSGAALSVVLLRSLSVEDQQAVTKTKSAAVNANGTPLDVRG